MTPSRYASLSRTRYWPEPATDSSCWLNSAGRSRTRRSMALSTAARSCGDVFAHCGIGVSLADRAGVGRGAPAPAGGRRGRARGGDRGGARSGGGRGLVTAGSRGQSGGHHEPGDRYTTHKVHVNPPELGARRAVGAGAKKTVEPVYLAPAGPDKVKARGQGFTTRPATPRSASGARPSALHGPPRDRPEHPNCSRRLSSPGVRPGSGRWSGRRASLPERRPASVLKTRPLSGPASPGGRGGRGGPAGRRGCRRAPSGRREGVGRRGAPRGRPGR